MNQLEQLQQLINNGFYLQNICDVIALCREISNDDYLLLAHTLKGIYVDILPYFEETPIISEKTDYLNSILVPEITNAVQKIQSGSSKIDQYDIFVHLIKLSQETIIRWL